MRRLILLNALAVLAFGASALVQGIPPQANPKPHCYFEPGGEPTCPACQVFDSHICKCMKVPACKL